MFLIASLLLTASMAFAPLTESAALDSPYRHIRSQDRSIRLLLKRGFNRSRTFAQLMARLEHSDVLVYIEEVPRLPGALEGRLLVLQPAHGFRYVRIQIARRGGPNDSIAVLAHELRHAIEVADDPSVINAQTLIALYRRIGIDHGNNEYDTIAAQETGRRVLKELVA